MANIAGYVETNIKPLDQKFIRMYRSYERYVSHLTPESQVLEIGPGNGGFSLQLSKTFSIKPSQFTLLDISTSVTEKLQKQEETKTMHSYTEDAVEFLSKTKDTYDLIILRHVLEHFDKATIEKLLPLMYTRLNSGGVCLIEVPNLGNGNLGTYMYFQDFSHFTPFTAKSLIECVHWNIPEAKIECHNITYPLFLFSSGFRWWITFAIGKMVELTSALFSIYTLAYGNRVFTPRMVGIITKS